MRCLNSQTLSAIEFDADEFNRPSGRHGAVHDIRRSQSPDTDKHPHRAHTANRFRQLVEPLSELIHDPRKIHDDEVRGRRLTIGTALGPELGVQLLEEGLGDAYLASAVHEGSELSSPRP